MKTKASSRAVPYFLAFTLICYLLPIGLILLEVIPFEFRFRVLVIMAIVLFLYAIINRHSLHDLGIRSDTLKGSLVWNVGVSVIFAIELYLACALGKIRAPTPPDWSSFYVFYVFISSPSQEFLYRGLFFAEMKKCGIHNPRVLIFLSAINYCFLHVIYRDTLTLAATLFMGIVWGWIYHRYPNLLGVTLSHAVLGAISISVGLV